MFLQTGSVDFWIVLLAAAGILAALVYVMTLKNRMQREKHEIVMVSATIIDYFRRSGVEVDVGSVRQHGNKRFTVFIESEPMKRFRLSHIIEATLREHVQRSCGLELDKVYWRFPIKNAVQNMTAAEDASKPSNPAADADDYINEGLVHYKHLPQVEVTELSWEKFEEVNTIASEKKAATGDS
jgi:hypothetical protein